MRKEALAAVLLLCCGCGVRSTTPEVLGGHLGASKTVWPGGAPAAATVFFDDYRPSSYELAAPALEAFGFRGTFSLNTAPVEDWTPWAKLHKAGHEIASHTHTHRYLPYIPEADVIDELKRSKDLISENIATPVSFVYPGNQHAPWVVDLVADHYSYARCGADGSGLPYLVQAFGYYAPFDMTEMLDNLSSVIAAGGWYVCYFHGVTEGEASQFQVPLDVLNTHLQQLADSSLWVAPFREVAEWLE